MLLSVLAVQWSKCTSPLKFLVRVVKSSVIPLHLAAVGGPSTACVVVSPSSCVMQVVQFKQQSRLEEKRKKALDLQLDFIVGQTERYSDLLSQSLGDANVAVPLSVGVAANCDTANAYVRAPPHAAEDDGKPPCNPAPCLTHSDWAKYLTAFLFSCLQFEVEIIPHTRDLKLTPAKHRI